MKTILNYLFGRRIIKLSDTVYKFDKFILKLDESKYYIYLSNSISDKYNDRKYEIYFESLYFCKFDRDMMKSIKYFLKTYKNYKK
jgi:hypothetical protein